MFRALEMFRVDPYLDSGGPSLALSSFLSRAASHGVQGQSTT